MIYSKLPISIADQIALMKSRGLIVGDELEAERELRVISYFRLADYLTPLEADKVTHRFKAGATLDDALRLYYFDKELRQLIFTALQSVEVALRSKMIHHCAMAYGAHWFMDMEWFKDRAFFMTTLKKVMSDVERSKEEFVKEYFEDYTMPILPPAWKTMEVITFGSLSKMYDNLKERSVKRAIALELGVPTHLIMESWVQCAAVLRNLCCHHNRVWNRKFSVKPQLPVTLSGDWITMRDAMPVKVYWQLCVLQYLENAIHPGNAFGRELKALLRKYPSVDVAAMGFPEGWDEEPLWKDKVSTSDEDAGSDSDESDEAISETEASAEVQSTDAASEEVADGETASDVSTDGEASDKE